MTLVAALILGSQAFGDKGLVYPLLIPAIGALTAVAGVYLTRPKAGENGLTTINRSFYLSSGIAALASVKQAAALANRDLGLLDEDKATSPKPAARYGRVICTSILSST